MSGLTRFRSMQVSRRKFIRISAATAALAGLSSTLRAAPMRRNTRLRSGRARNIIFLVCDGMNIGALSLAHAYSRLTAAKDSTWMQLYQSGRGKRSLMETHSADALVTDSAAAASSWGCGHKVNNGSLNILPDHSKPAPILLTARKAGKSTGLVTTARITHATPAGFAVNQASRNAEPAIARDYLDAGIDVLMGGGARHFDPQSREDGQDLYALSQAAGYQRIDERHGLRKLSPQSGKVLGLFSSDHLPYTIDWKHNPALQQSVPTLAEMTRSALAVLSRNSRGFVVQIEGARIDHAAHHNDAAALLFDQLAFEEALQACLDFQRAHPDTLLILCTDHGTGGVNFNGLGPGYAQSAAAVKRLQHFKASYAPLVQTMLHAASAATIDTQVRDLCGIQLTPEHTQQLLTAVESASSLSASAASRAARKALGSVLSHYTSVNWTGSAHTGEAVECYATGPGSELLAPVIDNTDLHGLMRKASNI